jgi:hypothetical protein
MCDVLLPPGVNPTAVKYIYIYIISYHELRLGPLRLLSYKTRTEVSCSRHQNNSAVTRSLDICIVISQLVGAFYLFSVVNLLSEQEIKKM